MGMRVEYYKVANLEFEKLMNRSSEEEVYDDLEELEEHEELNISCNLDKMWDALHFILTGISAIEVIDELEEGKEIHRPLLSKAIIGNYVLFAEDVYISLIDNQCLKEIVYALNEVDIDQVVANIEMNDLISNEIYPDIWDRKEEEEENREDLITSFNELKAFYQNVIVNDGNVVVDIN